MATAPHRHAAHASAAIAALLGACALAARAQSAALVPVRSGQAVLPESILRETYAAIDRARATLVRRQGADGLWTLADGTPTAFPALALCDPAAPARELDAALAAAETRLAEHATKPWSPGTASEAVYATLARLLHSGRGPDGLLATRLARARLDALPQDDAALALSALDGLGTPRDGGWAWLVNRLRAHRPADVESVAIAALARFNSGRSQDGIPARDVQEHLRWIAARIQLDAPRRAEEPEPLTPSAAFFITALAAQLPRRAFLDDPSLLPYNWRAPLASRLIARQRVDPDTGLHFWDSSAAPSANGDTALRETAYAIMTLVILAE